MEAWTCMSKRLDSVGLRCVSNSILCRLSKCKCRTSKWCYYCALFCLFVCDTELQNKCCKQKVQQQTIGRHSDPSDSFSFQTSQTDLCVFVFFMCIHSTCVFSSKLLFVSMTTSVNCGCPRDSSVKPVNFSYITDTHTLTQTSSLSALCTRVYACVGLDRCTTCMLWVVSAVRRRLRHQLSSITPQTICQGWCRYFKPKRATSPHCAKLRQATKPCCCFTISSGSSSK